VLPNNANTITIARAMVETATVVVVNVSDCLVELLAVVASATARNIIATE